MLTCARPVNETLGDRDSRLGGRVGGAFYITQRRHTARMPAFTGIVGGDQAPKRGERECRRSLGDSGGNGWSLVRRAWRIAPPPRWGGPPIRRERQRAIFRTCYGYSPDDNGGRRVLELARNGQVAVLAMRRRGRRRGPVMSKEGSDTMRHLLIFVAALSCAAACPALAGGPSFAQRRVGARFVWVEERGLGDVRRRLLSRAAQ